MPSLPATGIRGYFVDKSGRRRIDLRYVDNKGKPQRYKETFPPGTPARAAETRAREVLAESILGTLLKRGDTVTLTLEQAFDAYLEWVKTNRPKAYRNRKSIVAVWNDTVGNVAIDRLGPELLEAYKAKRLAAKAAPATVNRGLAMVKHMARLAARAGWSWMTREQAAMIRDVGMLKEPPGRQRPIAPKELEAIFEAFSRTDSRFARRVVVASLLTGCREGELLDLRASEVDFRRKRLDLSRTKQGRRHEIVITAPLATLLREALDDEKRKADSPYVFVNRFGRPYTVSGFSKHFAHVADRAECPDITFHDLRRHVGTTLINAGERLEVVSRLLGHSNVAVTQRSYAHLTTEATRAAFERLAVAPGIPPTAKITARSKPKKAARSHTTAVS